MNKQLKKDINQYIKEIKQNIICDFKTRKKFISDIKNSIYDFVECENSTSIDDVYHHFGTPQQIAKEFFVNADVKKIKRRMNFTKVVFVGVFVALLMFGTALVIELVDAHSSNHGYGVEYIADPDTNYFDEDGKPNFDMMEKRK